MNDKLLVDKDYQLEKAPGKGGWTYAVLPEIAPDKKTYFNLIRVRGTIDDYELKGYNLMSLGNGNMFLPVKAEIRKKIKKKEGDWVRITLYTDHTPTEIPEELLACLKDEPAAYETFMELTDTERQAYIHWIYSMKNEETKVSRIVRSLELLIRGIRKPTK